MNQRNLNVLFVCAGDCARAVMAEALLNRFGGGRFAAFSASIEPQVRIDPIALDLLRRHGFHLGEVRVGHWKEFLEDSARRLDFIIILSNEAGAETPAQWPAGAARATWRITDPVTAPEDKQLAMRRAFRELETRIKLFALLRHEPANALQAV